MKKEYHLGGISSYVKDLVYGANDGIITTFAVVTGATGAGFDPKVVIILGVANLLADGFSMGASNFLGERSENNLYHEEERREYREIKETPDIETEEVRVALQKFNLPSEKIDTMVDVITSDEKLWVDFMMKYELEMGHPSCGDEWKGALITFVAFIVAGTLPLLSFFFASPDNMFNISILATALALFVVGSLRYFITKKNWLISGLEMLFVGGIAAGVSYGVGHIVSLFV